MLRLRRVLLTGGEDRVVRLWNVKTGKRVAELSPQSSAVMAAGFNPAGDLFFTGSQDGSLCVWRTADLVSIHSCAQTDPIRTGSFNHKGTMIVVGGAKQARLFDAKSGRFIEPPLNHPSEVREAVFSPDDTMLLVGDEDGTAHLWNADTQTRRRFAMQHPRSVSAAAFTPDSRLLLTGSDDGSVHLWDCATGRGVGSVLATKEASPRPRSVPTASDSPWEVPEARV